MRPPSDEMSNSATENVRLLNEAEGASPAIRSYGSRLLEEAPVSNTMAGSVSVSKKFPQYLAAIASTLGALAAGTMLGWTSPTELLIVKENSTVAGEYGFVVSSEAWSWIGSAAGLGAAAMCIIVGTVLNIIGRKWTMLSMVVPFCIGWGLVIWATSVPMLLIGRIFLGISSGAFCVAAPLYTGEIAQKDIRGTLGSYFQLMVTVGILFVYAVGFNVSLFTLNIICGVIPLVFGAVFVFMPESPLYLVSKNRKEDAIKSLKWLRGDQYDYTTELAELQEEHEERQRVKTSFVEGFTRRSTVMALFIGLGLMFFQQMSGINAVIFYTGFIFDAADTGIASSIATIIVGAMQVISTFVASLVVDKLGRRILLLISISVMAVCTTLLGVFFYLRDNNPSSAESLGWLPIVSLSIFICMFSIGFGPIPWMMMGEIFAPDVKGMAASLTGVMNWILAFIITKTFTNIREAIGIGQTFWIFAGLSVLGTIFVYFIVPETKGKTLPEIQKMLAGEKSLNQEANNGTTEGKF